MLPTSLTFTSDGGSQTVTVQEAASCTYGVSANKEWIELRSTTVAGNGTVIVRVRRYTGTTTGTGILTIGSQSIPVAQDPPQPDPCASPPSPTVTPSSLSFTRAGGSKTVTVSGSPGCSHLVSAAGWPWIIVPSSVSDGDMTVMVTENTSTQSRSGTVTIRGTPVQVTQAGSTDPPRPNTRPMAVNDAARTQTDTPVTIYVLANDTDADNDSLTVGA